MRCLKELIGPQARRVERLWSYEKCRNAFRLVEAAADQRDPHFDC
jgi:hypothetical protein